MSARTRVAVAACILAVLAVATVLLLLALRARADGEVLTVMVESSVGYLVDDESSIVVYEVPDDRLVRKIRAALGQFRTKDLPYDGLLTQTVDVLRARDGRHASTRVTGVVTEVKAYRGWNFVWLFGKGSCWMDMVRVADDGTAGYKHVLKLTDVNCVECILVSTPESVSPRP